MTTRFAPAPTGLLHLGHVLNAATVWGAGRLLGHSVLLRVEDHDQDRSRQFFEAAILDDLDWLGFTPDIFPTSAFRAGRCDGRQSDRAEHYRAAADRLRQAGMLYGCACTRATMVAGARSPARAASAGPRRAGGRPADPRPPRELDVSVRGDGRRLVAVDRPGCPRHRPA